MKKFTKSFLSVLSMHTLPLLLFVHPCFGQSHPSVAPSGAPPSAPSGARFSTTSSPKLQVVSAASLNGTVLENAFNKTLAIDFSNSSSLALSGNLSNLGVIYAFSTNPNVSSVTISALSVNNHGLFSSVLPAGVISGVTNALSPLSLTLNAVNSIANYGTISSSGSLSLIAGSSIINASNAILQSSNNLNLINAQIVNAGLIQSFSGNINIASQFANQNIIVNNVGGIFDCVRGSLNVRDALYSGNNDISIFGGNLLSKELNIYAGSGIARIDINNLLGTVNILAAEAHVNVSTPTLDLGQICLSGDPTFFNTGGDIVIDRDLLFPGQNLAIVASGNISSSLTVAGQGPRISTSGPTNAGNITIIAGANIASDGYATSASSGSLVPGSLPPVQLSEHSADTSTTLSFSGASATGGNVDLSSVSQLESKSNGAQGNGGDITIVALSHGSQGGKITLPSSLTAYTGGAGSGNNGNFAAIASVSHLSAISMGNVDTSGGSGIPGNISVNAINLSYLPGRISSAPRLQIKDGLIRQAGLSGSSSALISNLLWVTDYNDPAISGGTTYSLGIGDIQTGSLISSGGKIHVQTGGKLLTQNLDASGTGSNNGGTISLYGFCDGGITTDSSGNSVIFRVPMVLGPNAAVSLFGVNGPISSNGGPSGGNGGKIYITSFGGQGAIELDSVVSANGNGGGGGGLIQLSTGQLSSSAGDPGLVASGSGGSNGGTVAIRLLSFENFPVIGSGPGQLHFDVHGGSFGSSTGNGGAVNISSSSYSYTAFNTSGNVLIPASPVKGTIITDGSGIDVSPHGIDGSGGTIGIAVLPVSNASIPLTQFLQVNGSLDVSGKGTGNGGSIVLGGFSGNFTIGTQVAGQSYVNGNLTANGGAAGNGGSIAVYAPVNVNLSSSNVLSVSPGSGGAGGSISALAVNDPTTFLQGTVNNGTSALVYGHLNLPGTLDVSGSAVNGAGGKIILAGTLLNPSLNLLANGSGTGKGGSIIISNQSFVDVESGAVNISARGGNQGDGGTVAFQAQSLRLDPNFVQFAPGGGNSNGGNLAVFAGQLTMASGSALSLNADGKGSGSGGSVVMASTPPPYYNADYYAGAIDLSALSSVAISASAVSNSGSGGKIVSVYSSTGNNPVFSLTANAGSISGNGGSVVLNRMGAGVLSVTPSTIRANAGSLQGNGGTYSISANTQLNVAPGTYSADGAGDGNGGAISFISGGLRLTGPTQVTARGAGQGNGGSIVVTDSASVTTLPLGSSGLMMSATGGSAGSLSGNGGSIALSSASSSWNVLDLQYARTAPLGLNGSGGKLSLSGNFIINGDVNLSGVGSGDGGAFTYSAQYATGHPLSIGSSANQMVAGTLLNQGISGNILCDAGLAGGKGGQINISVNASSGNGNLNISDNTLLSAAGHQNGQGGSVNLTCNYGTLTFAQNNRLIADGSGSGSGGTVGIYVSNLAYTGSAPILLSANGGRSGNGGLVNVNSHSDIQLTNTGAGMQISATGGSPGNIGNGGNLHMNLSGVQHLNGDGVNLRALGTGNGGTFYSYGSFPIMSGTIDLSGKGANSNGGTFTLYGQTANVNTGAVIGANILLDAAGSGVAGSALINAYAINNGARGVPVDINGKISALSSSPAQMGIVSIPYASVLSLNASFTALLSNIPPAAQGASPVTAFSIINGSANPVTLGNIQSGSVSVSNSFPGASITVAQGNSVTATNGNVNINTDGRLINNGSISALHGSVNINSPYLFNNGSISASAGQSVNLKNPNGVLYINGSGSIYISGGNGQINFPAGTVFLSANQKFDSLAGRFTSGQLTETNGIGSIAVELFQSGNLSGLNLGLSSSVVSTDSLPRSLALGKGTNEDNGGVVKVGDKFIVTNSNQNLSIFVAGDNSVELAEEGTELSEQEGEVYLRKGRMLVSNNDTEKSIRTPQGRVTVGKGATAMVKVAVGGTVSVTSMEGTKVLYQSPSDRSIEISHGQELVANSDGLDDEELIPLDGYRAWRSNYSQCHKDGAHSGKTNDFSFSGHPKRLDDQRLSYPHKGGES